MESFLSPNLANGHLSKEADASKDNIICVETS